MAREARDVTEAELGLMQVLWDRGPVNTRQITESLYGAGSAQSQYATVQKLLERLEDKGFVRRDRSEFVHTFTAAVDRDELIGRRLAAMADKLCGGSMAPILSQLARNKALTEKQRQALRELIDSPSSDRTTRGRSRKG
jgi:BlaI family transcriptional regulator, penicillinase repressor